MPFLYRSEEFKETIMFLLCRSVTVIVGCCFAVLWTEYYSAAIIIPFFRKGNWAVMVLYVVLYHLFTSLYGGYKIGSNRTSDVIYSNWLSLVIVNAVTYLQISLIGRRFMPFIPLALVTALQFLLIFLWVHSASRLYFRMFRPKRLVLLYGNDYPEDVIEKFNARTDEFRIAKVVRVLPESVDFACMAGGADGVVIYGITGEKASAALKYCVENGIRYYLLPSLGDILLRTSEIIYLTDVPLFMAKNGGLSFGERVFKRIFDILCSLVLIVLFSPVLLLTAACIKLYDGGPVIYRQQRCTQHGRKFNILKFRSMRVDAEKDGVARLAEENDPRITPVGCFIRKYRIDELPQFFNILMGDMSFVGPRPERPEIIERYKENIPEFDCRLSVKCGLTGYAQVIGRYNTTPEDKLKLDLMYIQSYSLLQDFKILLMTIKVVLSNERSAGVKKC